MHWDCYATWKYQRRFANQYFEAVLEWKPKNPYWAVIHSEDDYLITANPNLREPVADVDLRAIGPGFRVRIADWTDWTNGEWRNSCVHDLEREAMMAVEESMRDAVPDSAALLAIAQRNLKPLPLAR